MQYVEFSDDFRDCLAQCEPYLDQIYNKPTSDLLHYEIDVGTIPLSLIRLIDILQAFSFCAELQPDKIDKNASKHFYTSFLKSYQPQVTSGDGNCLWNMVSISLCGNESLQHLLRKLTTFALIILKDSFNNIIRKENEKTKFLNNQEKLKFY